MGIGAPPSGVDVADFVLEEFSKKEKDGLDGFINSAVDCSLLWLEGDIQKAMETYNRRNENGKD
jgi:PTH1 family peptidyl-tRNA hydrolase